ncbi:hypothetical protein [Gemmatimonas sp.]|uniref:hypothetical protein n=1 Tax=Gemmatimonas sp. TaxID=1962908 RepID=UPI0025C70231|nr:hypothetical protein [Gemmatimonas sp.]MCA2991287.1 hypothetical protein [Gemmatimonas sp.]
MKLPLLRSWPIMAALLLVPVASSAQAPVRGTYRLFLCATRCTEADSAQAVAVATVIIADDSMASTAEWRAAMIRIQDRRLMRQSGPEDNVCFHIERRSERVGSEELHFGLHRKGSTHWERTAGDSLAIRIFHSPDASYELRWAGGGDRITGEGWSEGWQTTQTPHRNAFFVALLTGPPTSAACR